ncbi:MAG: chorismate-binding protein [Syntrophaceae bacterium]|nr:chorismate-binding protein [bacterium]MCG2739405.1 chorismate-binding protein [Syntrophaceae bacterium]
MKKTPYLLPVEESPKPSNAFAKIANYQNAFLLESLPPLKNSSRYTFLGYNAIKTFSSHGGYVTVDGHTFIDKPSDALKKFIDSARGLPVDNYLPFYGGLVGFLSFDWGLEFRNLQNRSHNDLGIPDCFLSIYDTVYVYDHLEEFGWVVSLGLNPDLSSDSALAKRRAYSFLDEIKEEKATLEISPTAFYDILSDHNENDLTRFENWIRKDDIKTVQDTEHFHSSTKLTPFETYLTLKKHYDIPYASFINSGDHQIISFSPEITLRGQENLIKISSAKGIFKQKTDPKEKNKQLAELMSTFAGKNNSLISKLERIEANKFCQASSVKVSDSPKIQSHDDHFIITNETEGKKRKDFDLVDFLGHFMTISTQANSLNQNSGDTKHNLQGGSLGYISANGNFCFAIAQQPIIIKENVAHFYTHGKLDHKTTLDQIKSKIQPINPLTVSNL